MTTTQIVQSIEERLRSLQVEITSLTEAREALTNGDGPAEAPRDTPAPARQPRGRRQRAPRTTEVLPAGKLEQMLAAGDGDTTAALAKRANASPGQVLTLLRELEAAGKARRTGQRRGTRWHLVTDEDRIAARAAELARRRKAA